MLANAPSGAVDRLIVQSRVSRMLGRLATTVGNLAMSQTVTKGVVAAQNSTSVDIELRQVSKQYAGEAVVRGVNLRIQRGEFFSILGPSGCGKTTTLRMIAGFEQPSTGDILIRDRSMLNVPPNLRPVNTVFQSYALFNHMSVRENVAFGLRIQKLNKTEVQQRVSEALRLVKMTDFAGRYPAQLSGGQQQRVALARALVNRPAVVLLDEPLGALDLQLRKEMQLELALLQRKLGLTFVMVTHDQEEALSLSDRIAVMNQGRIEQIGKPSEIYDQPQTRFVADFIGEANLLAGRIEGRHAERYWITAHSGLKLTIAPPADSTIFSTNSVVISLRPEQVQMSLTPIKADNCFEAVLENVMYLGSYRHCFVRLRSGEQLIVRKPNDVSIPAVGSTVYVAWDEAAGILLPDQ
jgi:spermidine/putrescine transport system ATP-binding protein